MRTESRVIKNLKPDQGDEANGPKRGPTINRFDYTSHALTVDLKTQAKSLRQVVFAVLFLSPGCGKARVTPPASPFPPTSRWEKPLDVALAAPLVSDGSIVFAALATGSIQALDPATGATLWTRNGLNPGLLAARPGLLVFAEKGGVVWGLRAEDGTAAWKTTTQAKGVVSMRLDGNRVFLGGASGYAAL